MFFTSSLRDVLAPEKHLELTIALAAELAQCFGYEGRDDPATGPSTTYVDD